MEHEQFASTSSIPSFRAGCEQLGRLSWPYICFLLGLGWGLLSRQSALSYLSDGLSKLWQLKGKEEGNWKSKKELKGAQTRDRGELEKQWSQIRALQHLQQCCEHSGSQATARTAYFNFPWVCGLTGLAVLTGGPCSHLKPWLDGVLQKALLCISGSLVETIGKPGGSLHVFPLCGQSGLLPNVEVLAEWISRRLVAYP